MLVELITVGTTKKSATMLPLDTIPALVTKLTPVATNPDPLRTTVKLPLVAVGRAVGEMLVITAPGDLTSTLIVTMTGEPEVGVKVTVPVSVLPGAAAPKTDCRNVTGIG